MKKNINFNKVMFRLNHVLLLFYLLFAAIFIKYFRFIVSIIKKNYLSLKIILRKIFIINLTSLLNFLVVEIMIAVDVLSLFFIDYENLLVH